MQVQSNGSGGKCEGKGLWSATFSSIPCHPDPFQDQHTAISEVTLWTLFVQLPRLSSILVVRVAVFLSSSPCNSGSVTLFKYSELLLLFLCYYPPLPQILQDLLLISIFHRFPMQGQKSGRVMINWPPLPPECCSPAMKEIPLTSSQCITNINFVVMFILVIT